ncbi:MAG: hypothetical protein IJZ74_12795 [Clostridia bacterium]|nr:hypothetical protein [Clostridia bacterium]
MRKLNWQILLLALWPYSGVLLLEVLRQLESWTFVPVLAWMAGLVVACGINIIHAMRRKEGAALAGMLVKLTLIPYYAITFVYGIMLFAAPPAVIVIFLLNALLLLATSAYTLRSVYLDWRAGRLFTAWAFVLAVSQCIFVLDVVGSIILYICEKRRSH